MDTEVPTMTTAAAVSQRQSAVAFLRLAAGGRVHEAYVQYVAPGFTHHNPYYAGDAASLEAGMAENALTQPNKSLDIKRVLEDDDLVAVHSHLQLETGQSIAVVHMFRFVDGKIVEFWDIAQPVPEDSPNTNGMF